MKIFFGKCCGLIPRYYYPPISPRQRITKGRNSSAGYFSRLRENSPLVHEWGMFWTYRKLKHAGLKQQLELIIDSTASVTERHCAIQIAEACGGAGLTSTLTDLSLREDEPLALRIAAASCVSDHGEADHKARLLPLALQSARNGEEERLQAHALSAVWPAHCAWPQIRDSLGADDPSTTTALGRFLGFEFSESVPMSNLAEVLGWLAEKNWQPDGLSGWATATDRLVTRAITVADGSAVRSATVEVLFARISKHFRMFAGTSTKPPEEHPWPESARRAIAMELIPRFCTERLFWHYRIALLNSAPSRG